MKYFFTSLRFRLILIVLCAVIPAMVITYISGLEQRRLARLRAQDDALRQAQVIAGYQQSLLDGAQQLISGLAIGSWDPLQDTDNCSSQLIDLNRRFPLYSSISLAGPDGGILCSSVPFDASTSLYELDYFQRALNSGSFAIGSAKIGLLTQHMIVPAAQAITKDGSVTSLLVVAIDLQSVINLAKNIELPADSVLLMIGSDSTVLVRYPVGEAWVGRALPDAAVVRSILEQEREGQVEVAGLDGVNRLYAYTPVQLNDAYRLIVSIGTPTRVIYAAADRAIWNNLLWIGLIALLALAVAWFIGDALVLRVVSLTAERDAAEEKLRTINQQLEQRVAERTAALDQANVDLNIELEERKRAMQQLNEREIELEKMLAMLEKSNRELENFAYITSHDLQEPLRKIQAFGDRLVKHYSGELGEEGADFIERMRSAANRMQSMVNDLLTYSRVTTRAGGFASVDLNQIAGEVIEDLEVRITESRGTVNIEPLPTVTGDASQMRQLLQNLIVNSLKFHQKGIPPVVTVRGQEQMLHKNGEVSREIILMVEDNGIGFEEKYNDRIFLPFQRLHSRDVFEGSGIGLAICRKIAERHGGSITAQSSPGVGSRFVVRIPDHPKTPDGDKHDA